MTQTYVFANNHEVVYGKTCLNRSCSKAKTLLRRTVTVSQTRFILSVFYMLSFHSFLKQKTVKRTLLQTDNIFSPQIKNTLPYAHTKISGIPEKQRVLSIFSKRNIFLHLRTTFFLFQFAVLKECNTFDSNSLSFILSCSLQPTNNCFCATESGIDLQTILHPSMNYWFQYCDLH